MNPFFANARANIGAPRPQMGVNPRMMQMSNVMNGLQGGGIQPGAVMNGAFAQTGASPMSGMGGPMPMPMRQQPMPMQGGPMSGVFAQTGASPMASMMQPRPMMPQQGGLGGLGGWGLRNFRGLMG
jgi:hypothetical protein